MSGADPGSRRDPGIGAGRLFGARHPEAPARSGGRYFFLPFLPFLSFFFFAMAEPPFSAVVVNPTLTSVNLALTFGAASIPRVTARRSTHIRQALDALDAAADPLAALAAAKEVREAAEALEIATAAEVRRDGGTWTEIGAVYNTSKQGGQQRFRDLLGPDDPEAARRRRRRRQT